MPSTLSNCAIEPAEEAVGSPRCPCGLEQGRAQGGRARSARARAEKRIETAIEMRELAIDGAHADAAMRRRIGMNTAVEHEGDAR